MKTAVYWWADGQKLRAIEHNFEFEFPRQIGIELEKYLQQINTHSPSIISQWILSLPPEERLTVTMRTL